MMKRLSVFLLTQTIVFATPFSFEAYKSKSINVHDMGYRLSNRIYQREEMLAKKICSKITMNYGLTSRSLLLDHKFQMDVDYTGVKSVRSQRSSIQFKCSIAITQGNTLELLESNDLDYRQCAQLKEERQQDEQRLVIADHSNKKCDIYAL